MARQIPPSAAAKLAISTLLSRFVAAHFLAATIEPPCCEGVADIFLLSNFKLKVEVEVDLDSYLEARAAVSRRAEDGDGALPTVAPHLPDSLQHGAVLREAHNLSRGIGLGSKAGNGYPRVTL